MINKKIKKLKLEDTNNEELLNMPIIVADTLFTIQVKINEIIKVLNEK